MKFNKLISCILAIAVLLTIGLSILLKGGIKQVNEQIPEMTITLELDSAKLFHVFNVGETVQLRTLLAAEHVREIDSLTAIGCNHRGNVAWQEDISNLLDVLDESTAPMDIRLILNSSGLYDISVQAKMRGNIIDSNQVRISVVDPSVVPEPSVTSPFGMGIYLCRYNIVEFEEVLKTARAIGVAWSREDISWGMIETARGIYRWRTQDAIVDAYERFGIYVLGLIGYTTTWSGKSLEEYEGAAPWYTAPPKDLHEWSEFVYTVVERYRGRVNYWEIWNEADWHRKDDLAVYFAGTVDEYYQVLRAAYGAVKVAAPEARVLLSGLGLGTKDRTWLDKLMKFGASEYFEITNVHSYFGWDKVLEARDTVNRYSDLEKPLWITEIGLETMALVSDRSERDQARRLVVEYVKSISEGIEKIFWYDLRDDGEDPEDPFLNLGIIKRNGTPKLAFQTYFAMTSILGRREFRQVLSVERISDCYLFEGKENWVVVLWNADPSNLVALENHHPNVDVYDMLGETVSSGEVFLVGSDPFYVRIPFQEGYAPLDILSEMME